jgi:hypothetical protein
MRVLLPFLLAVGAAVPAAAHHGWGSYDANKPMTIAGTADKVVLQNPHGEMTVTHDGKPWLITLAPLSRMNTRGATADIVRQGVQVTAYGYPKSDGTPEIRAEWIEVDGTRFPLR